MKAVYFIKDEFKFFRNKYGRTKITFKSIADLRGELLAQDILSTFKLIKSFVLRRDLTSKDRFSTLQLIKAFVKKIKNENENADLVRHVSLKFCI